MLLLQVRLLDLPRERPRELARLGGSAAVTPLQGPRAGFPGAERGREVFWKLSVNLRQFPEASRKLLETSGKLPQVSGKFPEASGSLNERLVKGWLFNFLRKTQGI